MTCRVGHVTSKVWSRDVQGVSHVVNYDLPASGVEDWVHRVGRTGAPRAAGPRRVRDDQGMVT